MPLAKYDYDYYEYVNGNRVGRGVTYSTKSRQVTNSKTGSSANRAYVSKKASPNSRANNKAMVQKRNSFQNAGAVTKKATSKSKVAAKSKVTVRNNNVKKTTKKASIDIPITSKSGIAKKPKAMTLKKPKAKSDFLIIKSLALKTLGIAAFFVIAFFICYRYSLINEQFVELRNIKSEYATLQTVNSQIQADIESKTDLTYIENYAKYQLGMQKPSSSQIQYVTVEKEDKIMSPVTIEEEEDTGLFNMICSKIYDLFK